MGGVARMLPLFEAKMMHLYDTRWATYEPDGTTRYVTEDEKASHLHAIPRYWVAEAEIDRKLDGRWDQRWFLGWRDICRATDVRTVITTQVPRLAYGDKWLLAMPSRGRDELQATWASFVFDYASRQKIGGTAMKYFTFMQLPMPLPVHFESTTIPLDRQLRAWIEVRVDRLNGWIADPIERAQVRAELDALMFHVYGLTRPDVSYVMDTFPIVKRKDQAAFGGYRTKDLIMAAYDALSEAQATGIPYRAPWPQEVLV